VCAAGEPNSEKSFEEKEPVMADSKENSKLSRDLVVAIVERWTSQTLDEDEAIPPVPLHILRAEAIDLAQLVEVHYQPQVTRTGTLPGLVSVEGRGEISAATATELRELELAVGHVHAKHKHLIEQTDTGSLERAEELLAEFRALLAYVLEDGQHAAGEQQLARLREEFGGALSHDATAAALEAYAELAASYAEEVKGIGGFDQATLDESLNVARALRQRSADKLAGPGVDEQRALMALRNRLVAALVRKMKDVRRTFRFVFREYPELARRSGSDYVRTQRRRHRQEEATTEVPAGVPAPGGGALGTPPQNSAQ
jgi:methylmalonyl-CoA mutase cobalamin-binding subunit